MLEENKSYYDIIITGNGTRLVRDKIVFYQTENISGVKQTVVYLSNDTHICFDLEELTVEQLDHFMTSTPEYIYDVRK